MSATTANMGLKQWNLGGDFFTYSELSDNFGKIDLHDHTSGKGLQIPTAGVANSAITDAKLASPNSGVWRTVMQTDFRFFETLVAGTYFAGVGPTDGPAKSGAVSDRAIALFYQPATANYAIAGKTVNYRLNTIVATNGTAPTSTFTVGLYPVTISGSGEYVIYTAGTVLTNSQTPAITAVTNNIAAAVNATTTLTPSATTPYAIGCITSATIATGSAVHITVKLEICHT